MDLPSLSDPQSLNLYHGSLGLEGNFINIRSGKGIGWNSLTLGDALYTSLSLEAAQLFSHLVLQKSILMGNERYNNHGFSKVYKITLNNNISILNAEQPLDADRVRGVLSRAGVSERYLDFRKNDQLSRFSKSADLLCYGNNWEGNRNEYLTKSLGFDGLMIKESAWDTFDYYPNDIGIDWSLLHNKLSWPPVTVAIYNEQMVSGFELSRDGRIYNTEEQILENQFGI